MRSWVLCLFTRASLGSARLTVVPDDKPQCLTWPLTQGWPAGWCHAWWPCHGACCKELAWIRQPRRLVQGLQNRLQTAILARLTVQGLV